ncbi:hypothetical protein GALL_541990 [mine drainage metagenome]|uniref:Uncharacterized protein n=1 Tax=mine drainage metagenome TaxID=410659 RepID=A0A1J5PG74_9ZZZZ
MNDVEKPVHLRHVGANIGVLKSLKRLHMLVVKMLGQPAPLQNLVQPLQLRQAERGRDVAHYCLKGWRRADDNGGTFFQTVRTVTPQGHRDIDVIGDHHATFAASQCRRLREIEHRDIAEGPDQRALVF